MSFVTDPIAHDDRNGSVTLVAKQATFNRCLFDYKNNKGEATMTYDKQIDWAFLIIAIAIVGLAASVIVLICTGA